MRQNIISTQFYCMSLLQGRLLIKLRMQCSERCQKPILSVKYRLVLCILNIETR